MGNGNIRFTREKTNNHLAFTLDEGGNMNPYTVQKLKRAPFMMYTFLAIQTLLFAYMEIVGPFTGVGSSTSSLMLIRMGAMFPPTIIHLHQYWRFITPIFLHIGFMHFALNSLTLYFMGRLIEDMYGHTRFAILYILSGIMGNILSFAFNTATISAGASTSLFGLFAAFVILRHHFPENRAIRQLSSQYMMLIGLNLVMNFFTPGIDIFGHLGGLLGGVLAGTALAIPDHSHRYKNADRLTAGGLYIFLLIGLFIWGMNR